MTHHQRTRQAERWRRRESPDQGRQDRGRHLDMDWQQSNLHTNQLDNEQPGQAGQVLAAHAGALSDSDRLGPGEPANLLAGRRDQYAAARA